MINEDDDENMSIHFWPGDKVIMYYSPSIIRSKSRRCCDLCGEPINYDDKYFYFRPLFFNVTKKESYILTNPICIKEDCAHFLPSTISELEVIFLNMISYYEIQQDNNYLFPNNGVCDINYEIMKRNIETFSLKKLNYHRIKNK